VHRWFEVHRPDVRAGEKTWSVRYQDWLRGKDCGDKTRVAPVYILDGFPALKPDIPVIVNDEIPNHVVIPRAEMQSYLETKGATHEEYVTSTAAWMMRQLLYEQDVTDVGIWGISYDEHAEYIVQRPCMEHWVAFARALGITVYITPSASLCRDQHIYGFDGPHKNLLHTMRPYRGDKAQPMTRLQALGKEMIHNVPPEIQVLIDREKELFSVDTEALWRDAAKAR
jgi:hypothetical protein